MISRAVPCAVALLTLAGLASPAVAKGRAPRPLTANQKINRAHAVGQLTYEQSLVQRVFAVCEPTRLEPQFRSAARRAQLCGTATMQELAINWGRLSRPTQQALAKYRARPTSSGVVTYDSAAEVKTHDSPGGHFKIHYVTSTGDAPDQADADRDGTPDFVEEVALAFDAAWQRYIIELGFDQPIRDFPIPGGADDGGDGRFDVYLAEIADSRGWLGIGVLEFEGGHPVRETGTSHIILDNDFLNSGFNVAPMDLMRVTCAHEFMHAVQNSYDVDDQRLPSGAANFWYYEATAAWGEEQVFDDINAIHERLPAWFDYPEVALDFFSPDPEVQPAEHEYGAMLLNELLTQKYGPQTVRRVWETLSRQPDNTDLTSIQAFEVVMNGLGSSRAEMYREFLFWNYLTGPNDDGKHYPEAAAYPEMYVDKDHKHAAYPATSPATLPFPPDRLAANYVEFRPPAGRQAQAALRVEFDGDDNAQWSVQLVAVTAGASPSFVPLDIALDSQTESGARAVDWDGLSRVALIVGVLSVAGDDYAYTYRATEVASVPPRVAGSSAQRTYVEVTFDAPVQLSGATTAGNYRLESPTGAAVDLALAALSYNAGSRTVRIAELSLAPGATYKVTVTNVLHEQTGAAIVNDGVGNVSEGRVARGVPGSFVLEINGGVDRQGNGLLDLIAIPMLLDDGSPTTHLGAGVKLATYDPRLVATCGEYTCFNANLPNFVLRPDRGYFIQSNLDRLVTLTDGTLVDARVPFPLNLPASSWYLMGNPFPEPLEWNLDAIRYVLAGRQTAGTLRETLADADRPVEPYAWVWNTDAQEFELLFDKTLLPGFRSTLRPGEGAFVHSNTTGVSLELSAGRSRTGRSAAPAPGGWTAEIVASCGGATSAGRAFGVAPPALSRGLRVAEPPAVTSPREFVTLQFVEPLTGRALAADLKPPGESVSRWHFVAVTSVSESEVTLAWPDLSAVPKQTGLRLTDLQTGESRSMRSTQHYRFRSGPGVSSRQFAIETHSAASSRLTITGLTVRPSNRADGGLGVAFALSRSADVHARLLTGAGRVASSAAKRDVPAGLSTLDLPTRARGAGALPAGLYLLELVARGADGQTARAVRTTVVR